MREAFMPRKRHELCHPKGDTFLRLHRSAALCGYTATVAPRAYFFLSCQKKVCKKEALDAFYSAYAQKKKSLHPMCFRSAFRSPNALRATVESGFLSAR